MSKKIINIFIFLMLSIIISLIMYLTGGVGSLFSILMIELVCYYSFRNGIYMSIFVSLWCSLLLFIMPHAPNNSAVFLSSHTTGVTIFLYIFSALVFGAGNEYYIKSQKKANMRLLEVVKSLVSAIDAKSPITHSHSERVSRYSLKVGEALGLSEKELTNLEYASLLHDIGKIAMPDSILDKPAKLSEDEFEVMKAHPLRGYEILKKVPDMQEISKIILYHHERYDGSGYPFRIKAEEIPLLTRIITIADSFDVITSTRPYKTQLDIDFAIRELEACKDTHFDSKIVDTFIKIINTDKDILEIMK